MKKTLLKLAIISVFCFLSVESMAAICILSITPANSAYINAYNQGRITPASDSLQSRMNFGSDPIYQGSAGDCELSGINADNTPPESGYTLIASTNRVLPSVTAGTTSIGTIYDRVWRKPAATTPVTSIDMCYFGARVGNLTNTDHDSSAAGVQYFEFNDIARGGFSSSGTVTVGYFVIPNTNATPVYRIGRTFTSVQHRASTTDFRENAPGHLDLPTISGLTTTPATSAQQAQMNSNWVDFTIHASWSTSSTASMTYVKAACDSTSPNSWVKSGAIRVRQTGQEGQSIKEITIPGYAPPGAVIP